MSYYVVTTYHDVVNGLQQTLTGIPSSWKVIFRLDFHIIPLFPVLLFFRDWIFAYFYFYHFLLKVVSFLSTGECFNWLLACYGSEMQAS